jgi:phospholipid/cholesterol/gamma-HCH transport system substrate-binding protein
VKYHGINVGQVDDLYVDPDDITRIVVRVSLRKDTPIKEDTKAVVAGNLVTGQKYIELTAGTAGSRALQPGSKIQSGQSFVDDLSGEAAALMLKLDAIMSNMVELTGEENRASVKALLSGVERLTQQTDRFVEENRADVARITDNLAQASKNLVAVSGNLATATDTLGQALGDIRALTSQIRNEMAQVSIKETVENLNSFVGNADRAVVHSDLVIQETRESIIRSLQDLEVTLDNLKETTTVVRDDPSILLRGRGAVPEE